MYSQKTDLDRLDSKILGVLQKEGRLSFAELARRIHLSATPCVERVRRLEPDFDSTWIRGSDFR